MQKHYLWLSRVNLNPNFAMEIITDQPIPSDNKVSKIFKKKIRTRAENSDFPIIGIGASAGGLEALEQFFENMPKDNGMAFVVIQHLDSHYISILPDLLQRTTPMKVFQANDQIIVKPNCVYVIPPNKNMSLLKGKLHLSAQIEPRGLNLPIDIFFCSLADDRQEKSIGIILSGMGSDGSLGMIAIKEKNGTAIVQHPASAKFDRMPRRAIEAIVADIVAPADELPAKLIAFLRFIPSVFTDTERENQKIRQRSRRTRTIRRATKAQVQPLIRAILSPPS